MRLVLLVLMMIWAGPAMAQATTPIQVLDAAVNMMIRPGMANFKSRASGLESGMGALCAQPSERTVAIAVQQFRQAAVAYGQIEFLRLGPLMEDNRVDRLLFWPDRRGIGLRQVQAIIAEQDAGATAVMSLRSKSVAAQGFGALEFVLFGTGAETLLTPEGAFRCRYGAAIAANISMIADQLAMGWYQYDGVAVHLTRPQPENADYRTETEALEALVGLVSHGLEAVRDTRINPFIAGADTEAKPKQALFWRSGLTMEMIRANMAGMQTLVQVSGMARAVDEANKGLDNSIQFEFSNAVRALDLITLPVEQAVVDDKQAHALTYLVLVTGSLQAMIGEQLSTALGLSVGFSSLDGD
ncbi:imelysin family protein [Devosia sp. SL43]|uniref:imelysin family protein n=1 Tax=Devosia sp. SL43 TaxID=2806348 RepID=UPI001F3AD1C9|nr:imelysin family protein [Devosia sp. SL43]UJW87088.1 peptidase M75, Imelysin [Devosia sp. SL43]